jgi:hypothetical protein
VLGVVLLPACRCRRRCCLCAQPLCCHGQQLRHVPLLLQLLRRLARTALHDQLRLQQLLLRLHLLKQHQLALQRQGCQLGRRLQHLQQLLRWPAPL